MTITRDNCKIINTRDVYLHDDIIEQINYDCDTKQLTFLVTKAVMNFTYKICFFDVAGFEASACDYWGGGGFGILDFHLEVENCTLLSKLLSKTKNLPVEYERCRGLRNGKFFEVKFVFFSGDTLRIVEKSIWIEDVLIDETTGWEFS